MKKIILLLALFVSFAFSAIDEYKTDVYFGNGILTKRYQAKKNAEKILAPAIQSLYGSEKDMKKHIGKVSYAYNSTRLGGLDDLYESFLQKLSWAGWNDALARLLFANFLKTAHEADLDLQVDKYEQSIKDGHKVLVVAHSQGNLFAYEAYRKLGERSKEHRQWLQKYWE